MFFYKQNETSAIDPSGRATHSGPGSGRRDVSSFPAKDTRDAARVGSPLEYPNRLMSSIDPLVD